MLSNINLIDSNSSETLTIESREIERKERTAIIKNFEDGTSMDELEEKFREFGLVNKITIMCDKLIGKPKTYVYYINCIVWHI